MTGEADAYVMVLPVPAYRIDATHFAMESAFVEHLRLLQASLGGLADRITLVLPELNEAQYARVQAGFAIVDERSSGMRFCGAFPAHVGNLGYLRWVPRVMATLYREIRGAALVHAGSSPLYQPFEIAALVIARALGKKTLFFTDIDQRQSALMNYKAGRWNARQYWITRLLHEPYDHLQHRLAVRLFSLVLLKGADLVRTYGRGRAHVHDILDSAFSEKHIIGQDAMLEKLVQAREPGVPLRLAYFGRLTPYKGVDRMLRALREALSQTSSQIEFEIIGDGEQRSELEALAQELGLRQNVRFVGVIPFGEQLFSRLRVAHVLLAAPLSQDTPRSALDAMASGLAMIAYDTYYYRDIHAAAGCVELVPWLDDNAFASAIARLASDRALLVERMEKSRAAAFGNTQELWLERRAKWTRSLFE